MTSGRPIDPDDPPVPPSRRIDMTRPNIARVYDAFLGGKDNYAADRAVVSEIQSVEDDGPGTQLARFVESVFARSGLDPVVFRPRAEIEGFFDGLDLVEPGVTRVRDWWPDGPLLAQAGPVDGMIVGAVARKP